MPMHSVSQTTLHRSVALRFLPAKYWGKGKSHSTEGIHFPVDEIVEIFLEKVCS